MDRFVYKVAPYALAHGAIRKVVQLHGDVVADNIYTNKPERVYITTKCLIFSVGVLSNVSLWPFNVFRDMYRLEAYARNEYKKPVDIVDHFLY